MDTASGRLQLILLTVDGIGGHMDWHDWTTV